MILLLHLSRSSLINIQNFKVIKSFIPLFDFVNDPAFSDSILPGVSISNAYGKLFQIHMNDCILLSDICKVL